MRRKPSGPRSGPGRASVKSTSKTTARSTGVVKQPTYASTQSLDLDGAGRMAGESALDLEATPRPGASTPGRRRGELRAVDVAGADRGHRLLHDAVRRLPGPVGPEEPRLPAGEVALVGELEVEERRNRRLAVREQKRLAQLARLVVCGCRGDLSVEERGHEQRVRLLAGVVVALRRGHDRLEAVLEVPERDGAARQDDDRRRPSPRAHDLRLLGLEDRGGHARRRDAAVGGAAAPGYRLA